MDGGTPDAAEFAGLVTDESATTLCVAPPQTVTTAIVDRLYAEHGDAESPVDGEATSEPVARVLYPDERIDRLVAEFCRATRAKELIERDVLSIRTIDEVTQRLTVADDRVYAHVRLDGRRRVLTAVDGSFTASLRDAYERQWAASRPARIDVPARSTFVETFRESFPDAAETLAATLDADVSVPQDGAFDPVTVTALVAARHEIQTLELSDWAESIEFSSRTELSRVTTRLTDCGLVETERVPHGVGRPRQRLTLADPELASCPPAAFAATARERLAE